MQGIAVQYRRPGTLSPEFHALNEETWLPQSYTWRCTIPNMLGGVPCFRS